MTQVLLSGAKIEENFLKAERFYEGGPLFFIINISLNNDMFQKLSKISISFLNKQMFKNHFGDFESTIATSNYKYYNVIPTGLSFNNSLYQYQTKKFGINSVLGYNQNNNLKIIKIDVIKNNIYNIGLNKYQIFIPLQTSREIFNNDSSYPVHCRFFIKDEDDNIIWDSDIVVPHKRLTQLASEANEIINTNYIMYYLNNTLQSSFLFYRDSNYSYPQTPYYERVLRQSIGINFSEAFNFTSLNLGWGGGVAETGDVLSRSQSNDVGSVNINLKYGNISIPVTYGSKSINSLDENSLITTLDTNGTIHKVSENLEFIEAFLKDYVNGKENFVFTLSLNTSAINTPTLSKTYTRQDNFITRMYQDLLNSYNIIITNKFNFSFDFSNLGNNKIKHTIKFNNLLLPTDAIKITEIQTGNNTQNYAVYFEENTSDVYYLKDFKNIDELLLLCNTDEQGNKYFYTYASSSLIFGAASIKYTLTYTDGDFTKTKNFFGEEILLDLYTDNINTKELLIQLNDIFKTNISLEFLEDNINLNLNNPMIRQIQNIKLSDINSFTELALFYGYDSSNEFLSNCIVKLSDYSTFNTGEQKQTLGYSNYFIFEELFDIDKTTTSNHECNSIINFNELINQDFNVSSERGFTFLSSLVANKNHEFTRLLNTIDTFNYLNEVSLIIFPIHKLMSKYKNKGIDENGNVINSFNNVEEAIEVNKIFYNMFYDSLTTLDFTSIQRAKESYFKENSSMNYFYNCINDNFIQHLMLSNSGNSVSSSVYTKNQDDFRTLISEIGNVSIISPEPVYAYEFNTRMFSKDMRVNYFTRIEDAITSNINPGSNNDNTDIIQLYFPTNILFDINFIKSLGMDLNEAGIIQGSNYDIRLNLVPYFVKNENSQQSEVSFDENHPIFNSIEYNGKNCITLKSDIYNENFVGYKSILYSGVLDNEIISDNSSNFTLILDLEKSGKKIDFFEKNIYRSYLNSGIINSANSLGYDQLYELALNVCILIRPDPSKTDTNIFFSDYYQIRLFNILPDKQCPRINNITKIECIRT